MTEHNKFLAKYHERLRGNTKNPSSLTPEKPKEPEKKHVINPFKKHNNLDSEMEAPPLPKSSSNLTPSYNFESMKSFNSNPEFVRLTTETFPTLQAYPQVSFPVACFLKPLGNTVILLVNSCPNRQSIH